MLQFGDLHPQVVIGICGKVQLSEMRSVRKRYVARGLPSLRYMSIVDCRLSMLGQGTRPASGPGLWERLVRTPGPEVVGSGGANRLMDLPSYSYLARGQLFLERLAYMINSGIHPKGSPEYPGESRQNASPYRYIRLFCSTAPCCETRRPPLCTVGGAGLPKGFKNST